MTIPEVAVLVGSDLRFFAAFLPRMDDLLANHEPYDAFISTDAKSLSCAQAGHLLARTYVRWVGVTNTDASLRHAFGKPRPEFSPNHLHQWWRLQQ